MKTAMKRFSPLSGFGLSGGFGLPAGWFAGLAVAGGVVCVVAAWLDRAAFPASYFYGFILWFCVSLGALALLMTHHLSGGRWGFVVRRVLEAALAPLPALAVLFFAFFFLDPALRRGEGYFAPGWVALRSAFNFALWIALAWLLRSRSLRQDGSTEPRWTRELRTISGPGLVLYFLTMSFAGVDWLMALEPGWRSTMFPGILMATQALLGLSGAVAVFFWLPRARTEPLQAVATTQAWHDLGKLLFAFVIFWAYVAFSQLLVIWSGNLPHELVWYRDRSTAGWGALAKAIGAVCFFAPAAVLLFQGPKRAPRVLAGVAAGIWVSQAIYLYWVTLPAFRPALAWSGMDVIAPLAVGAIWAAFFGQAWCAAPPLPQNDPRLAQLDIVTA